MNKIGILGGTFDPVHQAHIAIAETVLKACHLDWVELIPCHQPVHRPQPVATPEQRLQLLQLAIKNHPHLKINTCELDRPGPSYTIDTLQFLKQTHPDSCLHLTLGLDAFAHFTQWREWESILEMAHLIITHRPESGLNPNSPEAGLLKKHRIASVNALQSTSHGAILEIKTLQENISASNIRDALKQHKDLSTVLNPAVLDAIRQQKLYE